MKDKFELGDGYSSRMVFLELFDKNLYQQSLKPKLEDMAKCRKSNKIKT